MAKFTDDCIARMDVRCRGVKAEARSLSGGNRQKYFIGREMVLNPKILIAALQAITGTLYTVLLLSRLVGIHAAHE